MSTDVRALAAVIGRVLGSAGTSADIPDPAEIADLLYLALVKERLWSAPGPPAAETASSSHNRGAEPPAASSRRTSESDAETTSPTVPVRLPSGFTTGAAEPAALVALRSGAALHDPLDVMRALRPFKKVTAAGNRSRIDLDATIEATAEARRLIVVPQATAERVLDVALVADTGSSMDVWQPVLDELARVLEQLGAFRSVTRWDLVADRQDQASSAVRLRDPHGVEHDPARLVTVTGQRLILVATDATDDYWYLPSVWRTLHLWARAMPTAIVQMLPDSYWRDTALGRPTTVARAPRTVCANESLELRASSWSREADAADETSEIPIPVFSLTPDSLATWAGALVQGTAWVDCVAARPPSTAPPAEANAELRPAERVRVFLARASPGAERLAQVLACASVLSLPLMRLIQERLALGTGTAELAEVMVGGLLEAIDSSRSQETRRYRFRQGVAELLNRGNTAMSEWEIYGCVSEHLKKRGHGSGDLPALAADPCGRAELDPEDAPFAELAGELAVRLGLTAPPESRTSVHAGQPSLTATPLGAGDAVIQLEELDVLLPARIPPALSGLPPRGGDFVGRERAFDEALQSIDPATQGFGNSRVLIVVGMAGVGKTELAVHVARQVLRLGWFPGGAVMVNLAKRDDLSDPRAAVSQALRDLLLSLGVPLDLIPDDLEDRRRLFRSITSEYGSRGRPVLVILDDASPEQPLEALIPGGGAAIVTSRFRLPMLSADTLALDALPPSDAVHLLDTLLHRIGGQPDFRVANDPDAAAALVDMCGGLPLAVRLVAARLAAHADIPLVQMTDALSDARARLQLMDPPEGLIRPAFELSYRSLSERLRRVFRLLTINPGPDISTEAARVATDLPERAIQSDLAALARSHLIETARVSGRWRMHDLIHLYATDRGVAEASGDQRDQALNRLLDYYFETSIIAADRLSSAEATPAHPSMDTTSSALEWLDSELENLVAAVDIAANVRPDIAIHLPLHLADYLDRQGRTHEKLTLTSIALGQSRQVHDDRSSGMALTNLGNVLRQTHRFDEAVAAHEQAIEMFRIVRDTGGEGAALNNLGNVLQDLGRLDEAITAYERAAIAFSGLNDIRRQAELRTNQGNILWQAQRFDEAVMAHRRAITESRNVGDRRSEAAALNNLGNVLQDLGRLDEAITTRQHAIATFAEVGDIVGQAGALHNLGASLERAAHHHEAVAAYRNAIDLFDQIRDRASTARTLNNLGNVLQELGRLDEAIITRQHAAATFGEIGDVLGEAVTLNDLGNTLRQSTRPNEALSAFDQAIRRFRALGDRLSEALANENVAITLSDLGRWDEAIRKCQEVVNSLDSLGDKSHRLKATATLARLVTTSAQENEER